MILSDEIRRRQNEAKEEGMEERQRQLLLNFLSSGMSVEQVLREPKYLWNMCRSWLKR